MAFLLQYQDNNKQTNDYIKKNTNQGIISWTNTNSPKLTSQKLYGKQQGQLLMRSWEGECYSIYLFIYLFFFFS